jgi:hypothetical protein
MLSLPVGTHTSTHRSCDKNSSRHLTKARAPSVEAMNIILISVIRWLKSRKGGGGGGGERMVHEELSIGR